MNKSHLSGELEGVYICQHKALDENKSHPRMVNSLNLPIVRLAHSLSEYDKADKGVFVSLVALFLLISIADSSIKGQPLEGAKIRKRLWRQTIVLYA